MHKLLELPEMLTVELACGTDIERYPMLHDSILLQDLIQHVEGAAAVDHVVLGDDLEPIDDRLLLQNVLVVRNAETDADAVVGMTVEAIGRHD